MRAADRFTALFGEGLFAMPVALFVDQGLDWPGIVVTSLCSVAVGSVEVRWRRNSPATDKLTYVYRDNMLVAVTRCGGLTLPIRVGGRLNLTLASEPLPWGPYHHAGQLEVQWPQVEGAGYYELVRSDGDVETGPHRRVLETGEPYARAEYGGLVDGVTYKIEVYSRSKAKVASAAAREFELEMVTYPAQAEPSMTYAGGLLVTVAAA